MVKPSISVIISTYNSEAWLEKVLWSYEAQTFKDFEIVIADDGSKQPTFDLIEKMKALVHYNIIHVWHEDNGFQKTIILNKAILACSANYLLFTDGDCIARNDFVETHFKYRKPKHFLSGGYFKLSMAISTIIEKETILSQKCFDLRWLKRHGIKTSFKNNKISSGPLKARFLNLISPTNASWNGHNASGWKDDIMSVNGFDERMQYGGEDRELGERLVNFGVKPIRIRYSAICLHLDHARGYVDSKMIEKNQQIRTTTKKKKLTRTPFGIEKV